MEKDSQMKSKHIVVTFFLIVFALVGGIYIGFKNKYLSNQVGGTGNANMPESIRNEQAFEQFYEVWNILEEKHPYGMDTSTEDKMWGAISGLVDSLEDPYTVFLPPAENEDFNIDLRGEFSGVGMEVGMREEGLTVISPLKGSPAEEAGILPGDLIIKIDETITNDLDVDSAVDLIRGERGTPVVVTILRKDEESTREITIVRDVIKIPIIETEYLEEDKIFVIRLFSFNENSEIKFEEALTEFANSKSKKLILDLRNNPGGFLSSAIDISSWFLPEGEVVVIEKGKEEKYNRTYESYGHSLSGKYEMVILVNGGSASASEILAGALQEHKRATLVGTQTYGKGSVQELIAMKKNTSLKITIAEWLTPNGVSISKEGLTPDKVVEFDAEKFAEDKTDNQMFEAIKILNK